MLPALSVDGILECAVVKGSFNKILFKEFIQTQLLPVMNPFPGRHSVLVMDNCRIHKADEIADLCNLRYDSYPLRSRIW